jgi:hypothetical protein
VIIPAFNLGRYLAGAIDSALAQDPPGGPIEVIVIDDGSTDDTPRLLDAYTDRVKVIRQRNRGFIAAVDRGLAEITGEYVALLDADDEWPRDRLRKHVAILDGNPALGLVHGDMEVVDANGQTIHPSFFEAHQIAPRDGRVLGPLLGRNFVSGGASTFRASLMPAFHPIAPDAEIGHTSAISNRYRLHGANMGLGADAERKIAIYRSELSWRRWMMWHLVEDDSVTVDDVRAALEWWRRALQTAASGEPRGTRALLECDPAAAARSLRRVGMRSAGAPLSKLLLRALSRDPFDGAIAVDLELALRRDADLPVLAPAPPVSALEARSQLTIGWLDELLEHPWLLGAFAQQAQCASDATLAILAAPGADLTGLIALAGSDDRISDDRCDITVLTEPATTPARALLAARACARLTTRSSPDPYGSLPLQIDVGRGSRAAA